MLHHYLIVLIIFWIAFSTQGQNYPTDVLYFVYSTSLSPVISSISPDTENSVNSLLTISGTGFSDDTCKTDKLFEYAFIE